MNNEWDKALSWIVSIIIIISLVISGEYISYDSCRTKATIMDADFNWGPFDGCEIKNK